MILVNSLLTCIGNDLVVSNTMFQQFSRRLYTWTSPNGLTKNQIDYRTLKKRWKSNLICPKTFPGAGCGSDHQLLVTFLKLKLKRTKQSDKTTRYDVSKVSQEFSSKVSNRFTALLREPEEHSVENLWGNIKDIFLECSKKTILKTKSKTHKEWLIESTLTLIEKRRKLKKQG